MFPIFAVAQGEAEIIRRLQLAIEQRDQCIQKVIQMLPVHLQQSVLQSTYNETSTPVTYLESISLICRTSFIHDTEPR
jgi:hypothetical protein